MSPEAGDGTSHGARLPWRRLWPRGSARWLPRAFPRRAWPRVAECCSQAPGDPPVPGFRGSLSFSSTLQTSPCDHRAVSLISSHCDGASSRGLPRGWAVMLGRDRGAHLFEEIFLLWERRVIPGRHRGNCGGLIVPTSWHKPPSLAGLPLRGPALCGCLWMLVTDWGPW